MAIQIWQLSLLVSITMAAFFRANASPFASGMSSRKIAGLMPGDTVIVKKQAPAKLGDIVVAIVDNEFTVKYLASDKNGFFLKAGNKAYPPIRAKDHLEVFGLVVGSFRKYQ